MDYAELLKGHLDADQKLLRWPSKYKTKIAAILFLSEKFAQGRTYTAKEVDAILLDHHLFNDCCTLRRELVNTKFLERTPDGRTYWVPQSVPTYDSFLF